MIHNSLPPFINCTIHVMKNTFHKGIIALGQDLEGLAIDLQAWFKRLSCKEDDFKELSDKTILKDESFVLLHANKRWFMPYLVLGTLKILKQRIIDYAENIIRLKCTTGQGL